MSDLGFCVPCAAAVINPAPLLSDWKVGAKKSLLPLLAVVAIGLVIWGLTRS